uniref:V-set and transmembrane domain-containing protein 2-like protein n=1 Tax=Meleagris gallopavo TaxID=9103 RepID=A0A803YDR8_MELGA
INFSVMLIISRVLMGSTTAAPALFTETPHDVTAQAGEDVEMACSFRGSGSPSYSLEIQWWYVRTHKDWTDKQTWASGQLKASHQEEAGKDATKISVVKVVGSNISHKLRLSRVKPADEGTYECRVIDASEGSARQHKVKAYLRVEAAPHCEVPSLCVCPRQPGSRGCAGAWLPLPSLLCWGSAFRKLISLPSVFSILDALAELLNMEAGLEIIPCSNGRAASSPALLEEVRLPWCSCFVRQHFCHCFFFPFLPFVSSSIHPT